MPDFDFQPLRQTSRADRPIARPLARVSAFALAAGLLLAAGAVSRTASAQDDPMKDVPDVTRTIAIHNARIVQAPGRVIERGTVVMHAGLITEVGSDVEIPYDAEIIADDSLVVYAGFIDGLSHVGLPSTEQPERPRGVNTADPPNDYAGIQPHRRARELLEPKDESIGALRNVGFTAAHVVPRGRMLPGSGSVILLGGDDRSEMVLRPDISQFMQFTGGPGVYPATSIGVMAKLRQLLRESVRRQRIEMLYAENPAGMERPTYDPVHQALYRVATGEEPLFVFTDGEDSALEVHRALSLAEELGFSAALAGLAQGFEVVEALTQARVPLFVTLGLPKDPGPDSDTTAAAADTVKAVTPDDPATFFVSDLRTRSLEDIEAESENLEARRAISRAQYVANAATLNAAGLRFGVSTLGADAKDLRKNVREMVAAGLPEDAALAALTVDGARLLGLDRSLGTVESGKLANLVVTNGSWFDENAEVRYVFVEGRKYEGEKKEEEEGEEEGVGLGGLGGAWRLEIDSPDGPVRAEIELSVSGDVIEGRVTSSELMSPADITNAEFDEGRLTFTIVTPEYGSVQADFTVTADSLTGTIDVPGTGILNVTGFKVP